MTPDTKGFSLVELLVVIAIVALLTALLMPVIMSARGKVYETVCASNLRQVAVVCQCYSTDFRGVLPQANARNPGTLTEWTGAAINEFMKENQIPPQVWYCPRLNDPFKTPDKWMKTGTPQDEWQAFEFPIGYTYVANPEPPSSLGKFIKPVPTNVNAASANMDIMFDYCVALRPCPNEGSLVKRWYSFPHFSISRPDGANILKGDLHVEFRPKSNLTAGYRHFAPKTLFW
jgi:prepilin-type N-terminal cleavage/methylation domain-containing protein